MSVLVRAGERYRTAADGIESWHCFSAGPHYDPANTSFGAVIACDEHVVAPGAGFAEHAHRGVIIVSVVTTGVLRHTDAAGADLEVRPGQVLVQLTGSGVRHAETNGSGEPLRFVQIVLLDDAARSPSVELVDGDHLAVPGVHVGVHGTSTRLTAGAHAFVIAGRRRLDGAELAPGDSVRVTDPVAADGSGLMLVVVPG